MSDPAPDLRVENMVASTAIDQEFDLDALAGDLERAEIGSEGFQGIIYRTQHPKAAVLVFRTGRIVVTGVQSRDEVEAALTTLFTDLDTLGIPVPATPAFTVQNVVCTTDLGQEVSLTAVAVGFGLEDIEYEPEQFPGLIYRVDEPDAVVLLFGNGRLVVVGATSKREAQRAVAVVRTRLDDLDLFA